MEMLKRLSEAYGPAGAEEQLHEIIRQELGSHSFAIAIDVLGNLIATRKGTDPAAGTVVVTASMDEIGLMVIDIDDNGWLRVGAVGTSKPVQWIGQRVVFANQTVGVVAAELIKDEKDITFAHLYIDIGICTNIQEHIEIPVQIGDVAVLFSSFLTLRENIWSGKALDNRIGCAALINTLQTLPATKHTICAIFTAQHEVGMRGVKPAVYALDPIYAITVGSVPAFDMPKAMRSSVVLGGGPAILVMEKNMIVAKHMRSYLEHIANKHSILHQWAISPERTSDAGALSISKTGILTAGISIPVRYVDTGSEMVHRHDFEQTIQLLQQVLSAEFKYVFKK